MNAAELKLQLKRIEKLSQKLKEAIAEMAAGNADAAYDVMHIVPKLAEAMKRAENAGMDETGNDTLEAYEQTAAAINTKHS